MAGLQDLDRREHRRVGIAGEQPHTRSCARHGELSVETRLQKLTKEAGEAAEAIIGLRGLFLNLINDHGAG